MDVYRWICLTFLGSLGEIYGKELKCNLIEHTLNFTVVEALGKGSMSKQESTQCADNVLCRKHYTIQYIEAPPFSFTPILEPRLKACCGNCINYTVRSKTLRNISALTASVMKDSDFVLPILGTVSKKSAYGFYFIPMINVPDYLYITPKPDPLFIRVIHKCKVALPLMIIIILMSTISGFITWALETSFNGEEFPRSFFRGWFEGTYWSLGTTVGLGDKTPRSIAGKLFAFVWILLGLTLIGILTGLLTNGIMSANQPYKPSMGEKNVGVLSYRSADALFVAKQDANVHLTGKWDVYSDAIYLAGDLMNKRIDGIVVDKLTYIHMYRQAYSYWSSSGYSAISPVLREYTKSAMEFLATQTVLTQKKHDTKELAYGILVKDKEVFEYLYDAFADNRFTIETYLTMFYSGVFNEGFAPNLFSFENTNFKNSVTALGSVIGIILIFGVTFWLWCQKSKNAVKSSNINVLQDNRRVTSFALDIPPV